MPGLEWRAAPLTGVGRIGGTPTGEPTVLSFDPGGWCPRLRSTAPAGLLSAHIFCSCRESKELAPGGTKGRESRLGLSRLLAEFLARSTAGGDRGRDERGEEGEVETSG